MSDNLHVILWVHRLLIAMALFMALGLVPWGLWQYRQTGDSDRLLLSVASGIASVALMLYFRHLRRRYRHLLHKSEPTR